MKFIIFLNFMIFSFIILSDEFIATGPMTTTACVNFCFYPAENDSSYTRGSGLCLWAHKTLSSEDDRKVWAQQIVDSSNKIVFQNLLRIQKDDFCYNSSEPDSFPNRYALYIKKDGSRDYAFAYCIKDKKQADGKYDLIGHFDPAGCGKTDCFTHLGHYTYNFYKEGVFEGNATFWIVPDFTEYYDKFSFGLVGDPTPMVCYSFENKSVVERQVTNTFYCEVRCQDWTEANITIKSQGKYSTDNSVAHRLHWQGIKDFNVQSSIPHCRNSNSSFGYMDNLNGKLVSNSENLMPHFSTTWHVPSLSGNYEFEAEVSKSFDGRKYKITANILKNISLGGMTSLAGGGTTFVWKQNDNDLHYPENTYMKPNSLSSMEKAFEAFLTDLVWEDYPNAKFVLTSANLKGGGFFDNPNSGSEPPWPKLHTTHRLGESVDVSLNLQNYCFMDDDAIKVLNNQVKDKSAEGSYCRYESQRSPHIHCEFK